MKRALILTALLLSSTQAGHAQNCWLNQGDSPQARYCNAVAQNAQLIQAAAGIAVVGGNPVPGASSTLGMRIGSIPRITVGGRITGAFMDLPSVERVNSTGSDKGLARSLSVDAAVGLLSGWSLAPTIGGFGSLDLIASAGKLSLPDKYTKTPGSWAVGARLGILRESFTAPGVSLTGMYRSIGDIQYAGGTSSDASYTLQDNSVTSVRAVVGKRLFVLGANAGIGYDRFSSDATSTATGFIVLPADTQSRQLSSNRYTAFGNITWTMLILNAVIEGGYQRGGDEFSQPLPAGHSSQTQKSTYYGSLAIRLAL